MWERRAASSDEAVVVRVRYVQVEEKSEQLSRSEEDKKSMETLVAQLNQQVAPRHPPPHTPRCPPACGAGDEDRLQRRGARMDSGHEGRDAAWAARVGGGAGVGWTGGRGAGTGWPRPRCRRARLGLGRAGPAVWAVCAAARPVCCRQACHVTMRKERGAAGWNGGALRTCRRPGEPASQGPCACPRCPSVTILDSLRGRTSALCCVTDATAWFIQCVSLPTIHGWCAACCLGRQLDDAEESIKVLRQEAVRAAELQAQAHGALPRGGGERETARPAPCPATPCPGVTHPLLAAAASPACEPRPRLPLACAPVPACAAACCSRGRLAALVPSPVRPPAPRASGARELRARALSALASLGRRARRVPCTATAAYWRPARVWCQYPSGRSGRSGEGLRVKRGLPASTAAERGEKRTPPALLIDKSILCEGIRRWADARGCWGWWTGACF